MTWADVTDKVAHGTADDGCLPLLRCVCGREFPDGAFVLGVHPDLAMPCDACERRYTFAVQVRVYASKGADTGEDDGTHTRRRRRRRARRARGGDGPGGPGA